MLSERDTAEFVSKINKSVVTVRGGHSVMNSVSLSPGIYSYAVN